LHVGDVRLATNRIEVELRHKRLTDHSVWIQFESRNTWLIAGIREQGWLTELPPESFWVFVAGLTYLYKAAGIDLVHEQIQAALPERIAAYDITASGLLVWADPARAESIFYSFQHVNGKLLPRRPGGETNLEWPLLEPRRVVFSRSKLSWDQLVRAWRETDQEPAGYQLVTTGLRLVQHQAAAALPAPDLNHVPRPEAAAENSAEEELREPSAEPQVNAAQAQESKSA
jgi:hypothetical protein